MENQIVRAAGIGKFPTLVSSLGGEGRAPRSVDIGASGSEEDEGYVTYEGVINLLEAAADRLNCPDFGMRLSEYQGLDVLGALGVAMQNAETIRASYQVGEKYLRYQSPAIRSGLRALPARGFEFMEFDVDIARAMFSAQSFELSIGLIHRCLTHLSDGAYRPHEIWFRHAPVAPLAAYRRVFGVTPKFGMSTPGIVIAKQYLDRTITKRSPMVARLAEHYLRDACPEMERRFSTRIREVIQKRILEIDCTQADAAKMLGVSVRTLQRRLEEEDTTYDTVRDEIRQAMAKSFLESTDMTMSQISERLYYSEPSAFTRSCYRWFGMSPRKLRQKAKTKAEPSTSSRGL